MKMRIRTCSLFLFLSLAAAPLPNDALKELEARLDKAATEFKAMSAQVSYVTHNEALKDLGDSTESGNVVMKKVQAGEVRGKMDVLTPDPKTITFEKRRVQIYYPKIKTVQEYDLGAEGEQLDQFLMIGFGTSGTALAKDYTMKVLAIEPVKGLEGVQAARLELIPKSGKAAKYLKSVELLIPQGDKPYPIQEKISQPSGDYRLITYTNLQINPQLKPDALQLALPPGVKRESAGK